MLRLIMVNSEMPEREQFTRLERVTQACMNIAEMTCRGLLYGVVGAGIGINAGINEVSDRQRLARETQQFLDNYSDSPETTG